MSSTTAPTTADAHPEPVSASLSEKQRQIYEYLRRNADEQTYFKSRLIADDLDLSAKEVGANIRAVRDADVDLSIEKWGYSSGTTWMVTE